MLDEKDFQKKADAAFDDLKRRLLILGDEHGFDVEGESGKLEVLFEDPDETRFVISPNTPVREIWIFRAFHRSFCWAGPEALKQLFPRWKRPEKHFSGRDELASRFRNSLGCR